VGQRARASSFAGDTIMTALHALRELLDIVRIADAIESDLHLGHFTGDGGDKLHVAELQVFE
jgi:hypothetical protein